MGKRQHKEQFDKYKSALSDGLIVFTDFLTFHLFANGELTGSAEIAHVEAGHIIPSNSERDLSEFQSMVEALGNAQPQPIRSPNKLAETMAAKAKVIADDITEILEKEDAEADEADRKVRMEMEAFKKVLVHDMDEKQFADFYAQTIVYGLFTARLPSSTVWRRR